MPPGNGLSRRLFALRAQVKAIFEAHQRCHGSRRTVDGRHEQGMDIGRHKVRRIMREAQLKPDWKKQFVDTTDSKHDFPVAGNRLNRQINPPKSDQAWTSNITHIRTQTGWLCLAAVMASHSRKTIGRAMDATMPTEPVCRALRMAIGQRQPEAEPLLHSGRGSQYASHEY